MFNLWVEWGISIYLSILPWSSKAKQALVAYTDLLNEHLLHTKNTRMVMHGKITQVFASRK